MSTSENRTYEELFEKGQELERSGLTLPDSTPDLSRIEREIIERGQQDAERTG